MVLRPAGRGWPGCAGWCRRVSWAGCWRGRTLVFAS